MEPRFEDLRKQLHQNKDIHTPVYAGGTEKADLWLLTDRTARRNVLVCQYEDNGIYVSYSPPYTAVLDALGEYNHGEGDKWTGKGLRSMPIALCMRWGHPSHEDHDIKEIARYVAVFLPDHVPPDLRARILDVREDPNTEGENHD